MVAMAAATWRVYPQLRFRWGLSRELLSQILGYGLKIQGASLGQSLSDPLLKSLAGAGLATTAVGAIQVGGSVASVPNSLAHSAIANLFPAIAERQGAGDRAGVRQLAARYLLYVIAFVLPVTALFLSAAPSIVRLWLGDSYPLIVASIRSLAVAYAFRALAMVPWRVSWGMGNPQDSSIAMLIHLLLLAAGGGAMLALSTFSYRGILFVFSGSYAVSALYLFWCMYRRLPGLYTAEFRWLLGAAARVLLVSALAGLLYRAIGSMGLPGDLYVLLLDLLVLALSYVVILVLAIPKAERDVLKQLVGGLLRQVSSFMGRGKAAIDSPGAQAGEPFEER
jgi:O-antigen/teichoic acid export membrane protein